MWKRAAASSNSNPGRASSGPECQGLVSSSLRRAQVSSPQEDTGGDDIPDNNSTQTDAATVHTDDFQRPTTSVSDIGRTQRTETHATAVADDEDSVVSEVYSDERHSVPSCSSIHTGDIRDYNEPRSPRESKDEGPLANENHKHAQRLVPDQYAYPIGL